MPDHFGAQIQAVVPGSIGDDIGIEPGFVLTAVNGQPVTDIVDYRQAIAGEYLTLSFLDDAGSPWEVEVEKEFGDDLGLVFENPTIQPVKLCRNNCQFCFVRQQPGGMRPTLQVKDDDYRLSALQGSFVTLTNLSNDEWQRILKLRLSPLYVSVHTTNGDLRARMLRNPHAAKIMAQLRELASQQIEMHCQIVLVPGLNDGEELERSVDDLLSLWPAVQSLAVVPVGLTSHRQGLPELRLFDRYEARAVLDYLLPLSRRLRRRFGCSFVYPSDEFFVLAEAIVPERRYYDDFPQIENGVGLIRLLLDGANELLKRLPKRINPPRHVVWVTGVSAASTLERLAARLNQVEGLWVDVLVCDNDTFGSSVTVTGLLGGRDIIRKLKSLDLAGKVVLIPEVVLREAEQDFLDDVTFVDLVAEFPEATVLLTPVNGTALIKYTLGEEGT